MPRLWGMSKQTPAVPRRVAAELTGLSPATLKKMASAVPRRGPSFFKLGTSKQARTLYLLADIERWQRDPAGYEAKQRGPRHGK